jgi:hypothetical protein
MAIHRVDGAPIGVVDLDSPVLCCCANLVGWASYVCIGFPNNKVMIVEPMKALKQISDVRGAQPEQRTRIADITVRRIEVGGRPLSLEFDPSTETLAVAIDGAIVVVSLGCAKSPLQ